MPVVRVISRLSFEAKLGVWRIICTAPVGKYCRNILTEFMNGFLRDWLAIGKHSLKVKNVRLIAGKTDNEFTRFIPPEVSGTWYRPIRR